MRYGNTMLCSVLLGSVLALTALTNAAQAKGAKESVLYSFTGGANGGFPQTSGVARDGQGNLYGTTYADGADGFGTVFKLSASGQETTLYGFTGGADGGHPYAGVTLDGKGNLYGTTLTGGGACNCGTVFKIAPDGTDTTLYTFAGGKDGATPASQLLLDNKGNLYGTTSSGGGSKKCSGGCGTVFKLSASGKETVPYAFDYTHGAFPSSALIADNRGNLYGTASGGGIDGSACMAGCGTVFALSPSGKVTVLYRFAGGSDGALPYSGVVMDKTGTLYGAATGGGDPNCFCGVVFSVSAAGHETVLHSFTGGSDGSQPYGLPVLDSAGNLYGTSFSGGGDANGGTVYEVSAKGKESVLYGFTGGDDGGGPVAGVIPDKKGSLYGTTGNGGADGYGTVFVLKR